MHILDWIIIGAFLGFLLAVGAWCRRYVKGVADFLVAGRGVGRYLGTTAADASGMGLISIIAMMQAAYVSGLSFYWFQIQSVWLGLLIGITGWGIYRFRETRVMTLNELFERRYSPNFRVFCGLLCFLSGIINLGVFPIVEARFFVYFLDLPPEISLGPLHCHLSTIISGLLILISLFFCFLGGQVSVIVTDFIQGMIILLMYILVGITAYRVVNWGTLHQAIMASPDPAKMVNPFQKGDQASDFGFWFMLVMMFQNFYCVLSWAPGASRNQAAKDPREARIMWIFSKLKVGLWVSMIFVPVAAFACLHLAVFNDQAQAIQTVLDKIPNEKIQAQLVGPIFLRQILPVGLAGLLAAAFLALSISTYDTYFLTWASVLVQDVVCTVRKKPLSTRSHLLLLRLATVGVALFVWIFSILYREVDYIYMFMWITGAIYMSGAGIVILGGLYWARATTAGAWAAMITGSGLAALAIIFQQLWKYIPALVNWRSQFPLNGVMIFFYSALCAIVVYVVVSLLTPNPHFNLNALLHRDTPPIPQTGGMATTPLPGHE